MDKTPPPIDNAFVADGCEQFSQEVVGANANPERPDTLMEALVAQCHCTGDQCIACASRETILSLRKQLNVATAKSITKWQADKNLGFWVSAAMEDDATCEAMKADIWAWFNAHSDDGITQNDTFADAHLTQEQPR